MFLEPSKRLKIHISRWCRFNIASSAMTRILWITAHRHGHGQRLRRQQSHTPFYHKEAWCPALVQWDLCQYQQHGSIRPGYLLRKGAVTEILCSCKYSCRMRKPERQGLKDLKRLEMAWDCGKSALMRRENEWFWWKMRRRNWKIFEDILPLLTAGSTSAQGV